MTFNGLKAIDIGCGPNKVDGTFGIDIHPYPGVDKVVDIDRHPWPLPSSSFENIYARHIIEHVADVKVFMNEIHRIAMNSALVEIVTPHFSSIHSWQDPTHRWHLSSKWYRPFTEQYLAEQILPFTLVSSEVSFSGSIRNLIPKLIIKLKGVGWWEKHYAFIYRARDITTRLTVQKNNQ